MIEDMTQKELKELASQLRCPSGRYGDEIASAMEDTNSMMVKTTISQLGDIDGKTLLELGPGNGYHLKRLLEKSKKMFTVDISKLMKKKIDEKYHTQINEGKLISILGNGERISIPKNTIDKGFSINTIYFWKNPKDYLNEIAQCFKDGGEFFLAYAHKRYIEKLPFVKFGFELYNEEKIIKLCEETPFSVAEQKVIPETVKSASGEIINRDFVVSKLVVKQ
ncbi:class I SAM-dependent methyltransferase [Bacteriovoracaceae bacterium]|nr:class I SAM-dependent methyltransferase [Bacteriovoracaceae bacterium]